MKLAIVTGGSRGLGASLCGEYASRGWRVVEFSRSAPHDFSVAVDLSVPAAAASAFEKAFSRLAEEAFDEIVAISNAGTLQPIAFTQDFDAEQVSANLGLNMATPVRFAGSFVKAFEQHACEKTFVNISSGAALHGYAGWSLYCAAKAANENFVRSLVLEQERAANPVRAISVDPRVMDTEMQAQIRATDLEDFPARERFVRMKETGALRDPHRVAIAIADIVESRPEPGSRLVAELPSQGAEAAEV